MINNNDNVFFGKETTKYGEIRFLEVEQQYVTDFYWLIFIYTINSTSCNLKRFQI